MLNLAHHFTGTYAKNLLADWSVISQCITEKTVWVKDTLGEANQASFNGPVLTDQQINDAYNGPFRAFFMPHLRAYASISTRLTAHNITSDESFKESEQDILKIFDISKNALEKTDTASLTSLHNKLDAMTREHYAQWESAAAQWAESLLLTFQKEAFGLSDAEMHEFSINQPSSELNDRFIHLKIDPPKSSATHLDFPHYFILKTILGIHSALNRLHLPCTSKEIDTHIKKLRATLKTIHHAEKELAHTQQKALDALLAGL